MAGRYPVVRGRALHYKSVGLQPYGLFIAIPNANKNCCIKKINKPYFVYINKMNSIVIGKNFVIQRIKIGY
jgi:hypothetical protein